MSPIRLNLGCAATLLPGYINVDIDSLEQLNARYPGQPMQEGLRVYPFDIFNLPFADGSVDEVRADALIEHLSFVEEPRFFHEVHRVLRPGGLLNLSTPDFEDTFRLWLEAKDEWRDFFRDDPDAIARQHWFGQYSYSTESRWGYLTAMIYGSQNGRGQFHKNCYTEGKLRAILDRLRLEVVEVSRYRWKGDRDLILRVVGRKLSQDS